MTKSMTGYGRAQQILDGKEILVEIRSVNHRFFEFSMRGPRALGYLEEKIKGAVGKEVARGKVDVSLLVTTLEGASSIVEINHSLARSYLDAIRDLGEDLGLRDDMSLSGLARYSDIFAVRRAEEDEDAVWRAVGTVLSEALERFVAMRAREGEKLREDLLEKLASIETHVAQVEQRSPQTVTEHRERLRQKLADLLADRQIDEARLLTEAAIFAEKIAVDEETVRLKSHIGHFRSVLTGSGPVGRKLDFMVQEINREANTIGSKAQDLAISRLVVEIKSDIEKMREQIQNIE